MREAFYQRIEETLADIREQGLEKLERQITSPQGPVIDVAHEGETKRVLNFCANNYLGLADHPEIVAAAKSTMDDYGFGMASVRFICGTTDLHRKVEKAIADFLGYEDSILFFSRLPRVLTPMAASLSRSSARKTQSFLTL